MSRVRGSKDLSDALRRLPDGILGDLRPALVRSAQDVADAAEALVPEAEGDLLGSITVTGPNETTPPYAAGGGNVTAMPNQALVTVGSTDVRHGHLQEFGTVHHAPQPFLRPAWRLKRRKVEARIRRAIAAAIRKAGGR